MEPRFFRRADGSLKLSDSTEAMEFKKANQGKPWMRPLTPEAVEEKAQSNLLLHKGDPANRRHLLGFFEMQFGVFRGQAFKWVLENALGYAAYLVVSMKRDPLGISKDSREHAHNKQSFREYVELFPSGRIAIAMKEQQHVTKTNPNPATTQKSSTQTAQTKPPLPQRFSASSLSSLLNMETPTEQNLTKMVKKLTSPSKFKPSLTHARTRPSSTISRPTDSNSPIPGPSSDFMEETPSTSAVPAPSSTFTNPASDPDDSTLLAEVRRWEEDQMTAQRVCLPAGWIKTLPEVDQKWISKTLFKWSPQGNPELDFSRVDKLWWYPPQVPLQTKNAPRPENYFSHPLFLWMPRKLWQVKLMCPHSDCHKEPLYSAGLHQKIRQVVSLGTIYFMASEYLACNRCKRKVISWSHGIVSQLDVGHRMQFPCLLTSKLACDMEVVTLMRQRGLGNSSSQIQRKLQERHSEIWLQKTVQYLTDCKGVKSAAEKGLIHSITFPSAPAMLPVPKHRWLMQVYAQDVLQRLEEIKASITSQLGRILKMDSTKKVARKLAGKSFGTATWVTNVGNEHGQVLMSVLTASEGFGLGPMIDGLIRRYRMAGAPPPDVLYVDRDCCGNTFLRRMFEEWKHLNIRLDIWHFMRRFAVGCTTDSHQLYATFMSRLSHCIFSWDEEDLMALKVAKRAELAGKGRNPSEADVLRAISQSELALHCKRTTRGVQETQTLIERLIQSLDGDNGRDTLGVPLINSERMSEILKSQRKHVACIQDPPGIQLYLQTGTVLKGGHHLPTYRCARGSTSLESFHLHLNRFIPGTLASDVFFQAYLLDGLSRWNEDRAVAASTDDQTCSYNHLLRHAANTLAEEVLGEKILPYVGPRKYTGEPIGVEYLYLQTGKVLQDYKAVIEESETTEVEVDEGFTEMEEFQDMTVPTLEAEQALALSSQVSASVPGSSAVPAPQATVSVPPVPPMPDITPLPVTQSSIASSSQCAAPSSALTPLLSASTPTVSPPELSASSETEPSAHSSETDPSAPSSSCHDSVGPDNIEGYGAVQDLAAFLVGLRDHSFALTQEECAQIITLWQALGEYDKKKTSYPSRHQTSLSKGRYRATKKIVAPGVESTKRSFLGAHAPAQWPDCNRVVEAVFVKLFALYPTTVRCEGKKLSRYTVVVRAYKNIRECVISNARLMAATTIQLPEVNAATVSQWYCRRCKAQEQDILKQGIPALNAPMAATAKLPAALQKGQILAHGTLAPPHLFVLPPNTAGQAQLKGRPQLQKAPQGLLFIQPAPLLPPVSQVPAIPKPPNITLTPSQFPPTNTPIYTNTPLYPNTPLYISLPPPSQIQPAPQSVPYTTQQYRRRKMEAEQAGTFKRKYVKKTDTIICSKCNKNRTPPSHRQYFGNWFCEETETQSYDDWRAVLEKRDYGKSKGKKKQ